MIGVKILCNEIDISPVLIESPYRYGEIILEIRILEYFITVQDLNFLILSGKQIVQSIFHI